MSLLTFQYSLPPQQVPRLIRVLQRLISQESVVSVAHRSGGCKTLTEASLAQGEHYPKSLYRSIPIQMFDLALSNLQLHNMMPTLSISILGLEAKIPIGVV